MQIHILEEAGLGLATIDKSVRRRELEIPRAQLVEPIERLYMFAGWTLDETTRDLISPTGQAAGRPYLVRVRPLDGVCAPPGPAFVARRASRRIARAPMDIFRSLDRYDGRATAQEA